MRDQAAQQCPFGRDPHVPLRGDLQFLQPGSPRGRVRKFTRALAELLPHGLRKFLPLVVGCCHVIDHVVGVRPMQDLQKVPPALAVGALEGGEQIVADVGAVAVVSLVTRPRVVDLGAGQ